MTYLWPHLASTTQRCDASASVYAHHPSRCTTVGAGHDVFVVTSNVLSNLITDLNLDRCGRERLVAGAHDSFVSDKVHLEKVDRFNNALDQKTSQGHAYLFNIFSEAGEEQICLAMTTSQKQRITLFEPLLI